MVRPTSAADINSLGPLRKAASPVALMRDLDLLLRLSGRIVKGCRLPGSLASLACENDPGRAGVAPAGRRDGIRRHICHSIPRRREQPTCPPLSELRGGLLFGAPAAPDTALTQERLVISSEFQRAANRRSMT